MSDGFSVGEIQERLARAAAAMPAVPKGQVNVAQNYRFRGIDDLINTARTCLAAEQILVVPQMLEMLLHEQLNTKSGSIQTHILCRYKHSFVAPDGSCVESITLGEGMDTGDKAANKAHSASLKYALNEVLMVAYDLAEADADSPEATHKAAPAPVTVKTAPTGDKISAAQVKKLHAAIGDYCKRNNRDPEETKAKIKSSMGVESTKDLTTGQLETLLEKLEG